MSTDPGRPEAGIPSAPPAVGPRPADELSFAADWRDSAYACYTSSHKFCREVCPVFEVTRDEAHTPTAFHANVVAMERGHLTVEDVADDYLHCTQCGACEIRCPNTLFTGDFYRHRTRTIDVVRAMRALMVDRGVEPESWRRWNMLTGEHKNEPVLGDEPPGQERVQAWAEGLGLPIGGSTIMFVDCEAAFYRTSIPRAVARLLKKAGVEFGLMREQWCCGGPALEMGYVDQSRRFAEHNVADWRAIGARQIIAIEPHDYVHFTEDYPRYFGADYDFEIVQIVDLLADLIGEGRLPLPNAVNRVVTYHDPCRLNKRKGIHEAPRNILRAIKGLTFVDVDHITQWQYCSGGGGGLPIAKPQLAAAMADRRVARARELGVDTLVSACVWSERPLSDAAEAGGGLEVVDIVELVAEAAGVVIESPLPGPDGDAV